MIRRLKVTNFKSLRTFDLALGPMTALVGRNNAGKSNILDALSFVREFVHPKVGNSEGLYSAVAQRGGIEEILSKGAENRVVAIEIETATGGLDFSYQLEIIAGHGGYASVQKEMLYLQKDGFGHSLIHLAQGNACLLNTDGSQKGGSGGSSRSALGWAGTDWDGYPFVQELRDWSFYQLLPPMMRKENKTAEGQVLERHGENLSAWMLWLQTRSRKSFQMINDVVRDLFPEVEAITAIPGETGNVQLAIEEKGLKKRIGVFHVSDGELVTLALLSLLYSRAESKVGTLVVEELENHLHPYLLSSIAKLARQAVHSGGHAGRPAFQIIFTTHSPILVDNFELEEIAWVERRDGVTQAIRPSDLDHLKKLIADKDLGLGDIIYSGSLEEAK